MPDTEVTWRVLNLALGIDEPDSALRDRACGVVGVDPALLRGMRIARKSLDARHRGPRGPGGHRRLRYSVHVDLTVDATSNAVLARAVRAGRVVEAPRPGALKVPTIHESLRDARVAVVGAGPAGLFAALVLARSGVTVDLIDRGASLRERARDVARFHRTRTPDPESNLLFGEGGAGTYSDGKLYTRIDHPLEPPILEALVACGAPQEITYDARAHIGTDRLHRVLPELRKSLESCGVRFHWRTRLEGLVSSGESPRRVRALATSEGELGCDAVILAPGHSARDTWVDLVRSGVALEAKPFQFGVRIEHPQELVDVGRYGSSATAVQLGAASYGLACRAGGGLPAVHSFCMCPGGRIVASVNVPGFLCTNGMSNSRHSSPWANAALVTTVGPREFGPDAFSGVDFQREFERRFFEAGGCQYAAVAQRVPDFLAGEVSTGELSSSYNLGTTPGRLDALLPPRVRDALRRALRHYDRQIPGFASERGLLVGLESRSAGPIRLPRDPESRRAAEFANLFPVGEGAGYAGGIMSAAIDGARSAQSLLSDGL